MRLEKIRPAGQKEKNNNNSGEHVNCGPDNCNILFDFPFQFTLRWPDDSRLSHDYRLTILMMASNSERSTEN